MMDGAKRRVLRRASARLLNTIAVGTVLCLGGLPALMASTSAMAQAAAHTFEIPSQPLNRALRQLADQSGVQIAYRTSIAAGATAPTVSGSMSTEQAISRLLNGSGLRYSFTNASTVTILDAAAGDAGGTGATTLAPIVLEANRENAFGPVDGLVATRSGTGSKTDAPIIEIPQTINVVTAEQIKAQSSQSISEALRYTPGVRSEGYGASSPFDAYTQVRGFRSDLYLDGLKLPGGNIDGTASGVVDPWALERLEVLQGPSSGLYGQAGPGGIINMVTKRPTEEQIREVQVQAGSYGRIQTAFDFGGPIDDDGQFLYRITGLGRSSGTQVDFAKDDRAYIAPAFTWKPDEDTSFTILGMYQRDRGVWPFFNYMPAVGSLHDFNGRKIATDTYLGEPDFDKLDRDQASIGYELQHRFNDTVAVKQSMRFNSSDSYTRGAVTGRSYLSGTGMIDRMGIRVDNDVNTFTVDNQVKLDIDSGPLDHDAVVGVDYRHETSDYLFTGGSAPSLDVFDPVYNSGPITTNDFSLTDYEGRLDQVGIYAQDQIKFGQWIATFGGRYDRAWNDLDNAATSFGAASRTEQHDHAFTGRVGLSYLFDNGIAPYASYATSFQPETGVDAVTGGAFKPSKGKQYEIGVKYQPPGSNTLITLSAFDLTQTNRITTDAAFLQRQIGEARVKGIQIEAKSEITSNFDLIATYSYLDHEITKSANPDEVGRELFSTPNHQASLWGDYSFDGGVLEGLTLGAGARYVGSSTDSTNTLHIPGVALFDARVKFDLEHLSSELAGATFALNATNLFDKEYVSQCDGDTMCTYGQRRMVLATLNYKW
ncbi:TonB-dependent siderophore receptor [Neorhizobium alkalisoli]|nr:TonB-dependent siderophore receptor [Neorhizobium alkalisoli]